MKSIFGYSQKQALAQLKRKPLDLAVIHLVLEGIQSKGGGQATVIRGHLDVFPKMQSALKECGIRVTPYVAEIPVSDDHPLRDKDSEKKYTGLIRSLGWEFSILADYTFGIPMPSLWSPQIGQAISWRAGSASGATCALNWARRHDAAIVFAHDCIYAMSVVYASMASVSLGLDLIACWVVHGSALLHEQPIPNPERLMVESLAIQWAKVYPHWVKLGQTSNFMKRHVIEEFGAKESSLVPTGNGVLPDSVEFKIRKQDSIKKLLKRYSIPLTKPLVLSWGRPVDYKRYDILLKAAKLLKGAVHPVVVSSPTQESLIALDHKLGTHASLISRHDSELVASLLQWSNTTAAALLSLNEPCGITPMETRMQARQTGALLIVSDTGGLPEQVGDGMDGFITRQDNPKALAATISKIMKLSCVKRESVRKRGYEKVKNEFTWPSQMLKTYAALIPHVRAKLPALRRAF